MIKACAEHIGEEGVKDLLPAELKLRVNDYRDSMLQNDPARFQRELDATGDFNAWVKESISTGEM